MRHRRGCGEGEGHADVQLLCGLGEKGYFMHCSILFCSWFEVRMVL